MSDASGAPHLARLSAEYDDERRARIVERSIGGEVGEIDDDRSRAALRRDGRTVEVEVEARDLLALRAATNTWCSLLGVAEATSEPGSF